MLDTTPTFSAVIPSYNRAGLIGRAVRSATAQSHPPAEIIVVDDGSTDDTRERLREFGEAVRYVQQNRGGPARARNHGVRLAGSPWVAFLDSDDQWDPTYLETMAQAIAATDGKAGLYFADAAIAGAHPAATLWGQAGFSIAGPHAVIEDAHDLVLRDVQPMLLQFSVFDREHYLSLGGLNEELMTAEDTHLFIRCGLTGPVCAVAVQAGSLMNDDAPENRLTGVFDRRAIGRWENTVFMHRDILRNYPHIASHHRWLLRERLAESHWRLARLNWRSGHVTLATREVLRALLAYPGIAISIARRTTAGARKQTA